MNTDLSSQLREEIASYLGKGSHPELLLDFLFERPGHSFTNVNVLNAVGKLVGETEERTEALKKLSKCKPSAMENNLDRLREKLVSFSKTPAALAFAHSVLIRKTKAKSVVHQLEVKDRPVDHLFWGQNFARLSMEKRKLEQKVRIIYNAMLCFRDYPDNILIRSTDVNDKSETEIIDKFFKRMNLDQSQYKPTLQYLLAGEIEARDLIRKWFQRNCDGVEIQDDEPSYQLEQDDTKDAHLVLLGNPRTNKFIDGFQGQNSDFRYRMRKDEMRLVIRDVEEHEEKALQDFGTKSGKDFCFRDDSYDGTKLNYSFVILSRAPHLMDDGLGCTCIGSFSNASIGSVAKELVNSESARKLLARWVANKEFPNRFQCVVKVHTNVQRDTSWAKNPECILFESY